MAAAGGLGWAAGSAGRVIKPGMAEVLVGYGPTKSVDFFLNNSEQKNEEKKY